MSSKQALINFYTGLGESKSPVWRDGSEMGFRAIGEGESKDELIPLSSLNGP